MSNKNIAVDPQIISTSEFKELLETHDSNCVSIYIPTQREGQEVKEGQGRIKLKNSLKQVRDELEEFGFSESEAEEYIEPMESLLDDQEFWRNQSDCLAIFKVRDQLKIFTLPVETEQKAYVSDHFYLLPIMPLFNEDGKFYILSLTQKEVELYEATSHSITPIRIDDLAPERLEDAVGYDFREKSLQFRSGQQGDSGANFHGQGAGKDDQNVEIEKYFRAIDKGIHQFLKDKSGPLVLACVEHYFPVYKKISSYNNLWSDFLRGDPAAKDALLMHEEAWMIVEPYFQRNTKERIERFRELSSTGKTSIELNEIVPAAIDGRIEALFLLHGSDRFGLYDKVNRSLIIDSESKPYHASLHNLAAASTWLNGGKVYQLDEGDMPFKGTTINALYRY